jgi:hypothetical protein
VTSDSLESRDSREPIAVNGGEAFSALRESHRKALDGHPSEATTIHFALAGARVSLRIAGRQLAASIGRSFRHLPRLEDTARLPQLTVDLWDELATGVACPRTIRELGERAEGKAETDAALTVGAVEDRYVGQLRPGIRVWMDRRAAHVVGWVESSERLSVQDRGKPLYFPLLLWLADRGIPVIHAALVAHEGQGILLVGKGGTGKTTAALACLLGGLDFLGDDYVGLEEAQDNLFVGHSLYSSVWLTADGESRVHATIPRTEPGAGGRRLIQAFDLAPHRLRPSVPIRVVAATALSAAPTSSFRPVSKAATLLAVAPTSMLRLPVSGSLHLERMARLIEHVPNYELAVGQDTLTLPALVRTLIEQGDRP